MARLLFCVDADDGEHSACKAMFGAVGEVAIGLATGAVAEDVDGLRAESGVEELAAVGLEEIQMEAGADGAVAGGALGEEEERIFFADGVRVVDLAEEFRRVGELGGEFGADFFSDGVAALRDAGADGGDEIFRLAAEFEAHATDAALYDALEGAAPAGVEDGNGFAAGVGNHDGDAVGGLDAEENGGAVGHEAVGAMEDVCLGGAGDFAGEV